MRTLVIQRSRWLRGKSTLVNGSYLRCPSDGRMCCLGFDALDCGLNEWDITGRATPGETDDMRLGHWLGVNGTRNYSLANVAMGINDNCEITDSDRESLLADLFRAVGIKLRFEA